LVFFFLPASSSFFSSALAALPTKTPTGPLLIPLHPSSPAPSRPRLSRPLHKREKEKSSLQTRLVSKQKNSIQEEVFIRRRPPGGRATQPCGEFAFGTPQSEENAPRNILEEIVWYKAYEIEEMRTKAPLARVVGAAKAAPAPRDFIGALRAGSAGGARPGLIAEVKKASPSKGVIQPDFDPVRIAAAYEAGGATCLSVLTDKKFFQGDFDFISQIRASGNSLPILAKEFVVEAYQLYRARAAGADAVLLIAAVLPNEDLRLLLSASRKVGLQVLVEVHTVGELERVLSLGEPALAGSMLGINNRDLGTFEVDLDVTRRIMGSDAGKRALAAGKVVACESGVFTPADAAFAAEQGCGALLVGESLVREGDPAAAVRALLA
jgi:indole-3-glycerol phosphate synthase